MRKRCKPVHHARRRMHEREVTKADPERVFTHCNPRVCRINPARRIYTVGKATVANVPQMQELHGLQVVAQGGRVITVEWMDWAEGSRRVAG